MSAARAARLRGSWEMLSEAERRRMLDAAREAGVAVAELLDDGQPDESGEWPAARAPR